MTLKLPIYLDHHATTPCDSRVVEEMLPTLSRRFGNPASRQHVFGWEAGALVDRARERVAALVGADPSEIVFTSGATESINLAIKGAARAYAKQGGHIVTAETEHKAALDCCARLEREGFRVTRLSVDSGGAIDPARVESAVTDRTILVSIMLANNEIGAVHRIAEIGRICKSRGVVLHCDAVQGIGYLACDVQEMSVDLMSISGHKICGPKGVGALYVRRRAPRVRLEPIVEGGGHERGLRSGTLNVTGIVGLGAACELVGAERETDAERIGRLRDRLLKRLREGVPDLVVNGSMTDRLPNNLNVSFPGVDGGGLIVALKNVAVSSGSACTTAEPEPSHVLRAIGLDDRLAQSSIRFGLGRTTTQAEIDFAAAEVIDAASRLKAEAAR
jgi:cysteine desulfurase